MRVITAAVCTLGKELHPSRKQPTMSESAICFCLHAMTS